MSYNKRNGSKPNPRKQGKGKMRRNDRLKDSDKNVKSAEDLDKLPSEGRDNDPNWYFIDARVAEQASQLSFQQFLGNGPVIDSYVTPTIMVLAMNPSPGISYTDANGPDPASSVVRDGLNLSATKLYTLLSAYSGRTQSYAPQDVATMLLAISEVVSFIEYLRRFFGLAMTYNVRNRALPTLLLNDLGLDADDFFKHLSDYRMRLNTYITILNQIPMLDNVGYIRKSRDMYQKVYMDSPSSMGQLYAFSPFTTWTLDETSYSGGSILATTSVLHGAVSRTMDYYLTTILDPMIDNLLNSSTMNVIYADLLNLANKMQVPMFKLDYVDESYVVIPEYNRNALLQIHNLNVVGRPEGNGFAVVDPTLGWYRTPLNDVYPDPTVNALIYYPMFAKGTHYDNVTLHAGWNPNLVDMDTDVPDMVDRIEALRFTSALGFGNGYNDGTTQYWGVKSLPDHYCVQIRVFSDTSAVKYQLTRQMFVNTSDTPENISLWEQFDWAPLVPVVDKTVGTYHDTDVVLSYASDVNYFTVVDDYYLSKLNRIMFTGLFDFRH